MTGNNNNYNIISVLDGRILIRTQRFLMIKVFVIFV